MTRAGAVLRKAEYVLLACCMLFATGLLFASVALRYFFQSGIFWAEEGLRYLIVWITFLGSAACVRDKSHISIDLFASVLPARLHKLSSLVTALIQAIASIGLCVLSLDFVLKMRATGQVSSTMGNIPMFAVYLCMPIGLFLSASWAFADVFTALRPATPREN